MPFGQMNWIKCCAKVNPKTLVVLMGGGAMDVSQWVAQTPAILQAWYPVWKVEMHWQNNLW